MSAYIIWLLVLFSSKNLFARSQVAFSAHHSIQKSVRSVIIWRYYLILVKVFPEENVICIEKRFTFHVELSRCRGACTWDCIFKMLKKTSKTDCASNLNTCLCKCANTQATVLDFETA